MKNPAKPLEFFAFLLPEFSGAAERTETKGMLNRSVAEKGEEEGNRPSGVCLSTC